MTLSVDGWRIDCAARRASKDTQTVTLSPRAMRLLTEFVNADGAVLPRVELLERIWPNVTVTDESLTQAVSELRKKLGNRALVETVAKSGYRLTVPVIRSVDVRRSFEPSTSTPLDCNCTPLNLEAHALCLEARNEMVRCGRGSIERADTLTAEAVSIAPDCASVRAERAIALVRAHTYWSEGKYLLSQALIEADKAVSLDPELAIARSALGYAHAMFGHWDAAEAEHSLALAKNTNDPRILHYAAWYLMSRGRWRSAVSYFEQVGDLEGQNIKDYLVAAQLCQQLDPVRSRRNAERALKRARSRLEDDPSDPRALTASASLMALLGERQAAYAAMDQINVHDSTQAIFHASAMALIGETDRAILLLEELFDHGWRDVFWLDADPSLAAINDDRRFSRMRQSVAAA